MTLNLELSLSSELRGVHGREGNGQIGRSELRGVHGREVNGQRLEDLSLEVCMAERVTVRDWKI